MVSSRSCLFSIKVLKCSTFLVLEGVISRHRHALQMKLGYDTFFADCHTISLRNVPVVLSIRPLPAKVKMLTLSLLSVMKTLSLLSSVFH